MYSVSCRDLAVKKTVNNTAVKLPALEGKNENFDVDGWAGLALPV